MRPFVLMVWFAVGCGARSSPPSDPTSEPTDLGGWNWQGWTKLSESPFASEGHQAVFVDVYVPAEYVGAYRDRAQPAPVGMRVAKVQHEKSGAGTVTGVTVMRKMSPGYDAAHGDWFYGVYDPAGTKAIKHGRIEMCIDCHDQAADRDYLIGLPAP
ncbi:MAG: cytochrome P460 family protein [Myxococcota bacterium]|nr:cytochrome P460 family protein [Deltaproteobacteria bacterium]MDQ3340821.1 cytochrome P460 family protein [Myxococcota bacterium]